MFYSIILISFYACLNTTISAAPAPAPAGPIAASPASYVILSADISQPFSPVLGSNPEYFSVTLAGQWAGATPATCALKWDAGVANFTSGGEEVINIDHNNCTDISLKVHMTRFRVEPWFLWELSITAPGFNPATWRMKNAYETKGWTPDKYATNWHFDGGAGHPITGAPSGTLKDCLTSSSCVSN